MFARNIVRNRAIIRAPPKTRAFSSPPASGGSGRGPISWASLGVTGVAAAGLVMYYQVEKERRRKEIASKTVTYGTPNVGGSWTLVNSNGQPVTSADYEGKYQMVYFGFSRCPDICPSELVKVGEMLDELAPSTFDKIKTLFVSVDPNRDTLEQLRVYGADFHPSIEYLTGTSDQVDKIARAFRVYFVKADENEEDDEDYLVDHSTVIYFMGPDNKLLDFFTSNSTKQEIINKIEKHVNSSRTSPTLRV